MNRRTYVDAAQQALATPQEERAPHSANTAVSTGEYAAASPLRRPGGQGEAITPPLRPDHVFDPLGGTIPGDEPVFVLRASDQSAALILQMWIDANREVCPHLMPAAQELQRRMQRWADKRPAGWKRTQEEAE